jgi:hypothetical protein
MYEYTIKLPYKVTECLNCPFKNEQVEIEGVDSNNKLNGVVMIQRRKCRCTLSNLPLDFNVQVNGFQNLCPLSDKVKEVE